MIMKFDFSGYATRYDVLCSDGRSIRKGAFKHMDKKKVPLVWQHGHNNPNNILGHGFLEHREDGVYIYGVFNDTPQGLNAKQLVRHGDIDMMSIFANQIKETIVDKIKNYKSVMHGMIREVSLVMSGANSEAFIDNVVIEHSDNTFSEDPTEALIVVGSYLEHMDEVDVDLEDEELEHADESIAEIFDTMSDKQKDAVYALLAHAFSQNDSDLEQSDDDDNTFEHEEDGGYEMKRNVFDKEDNTNDKVGTLSHAQFQSIMDEAQKTGSFKSAVLAHAVEYGIENIDVLFPDAQTLSKDPEWLERETSWVSGVLARIHKSPFSRIKSVFADMDIDTARARGYIKATEKKEVYFSASKRVTTPTTVYVKQKLDRDDIIDVTDFDVIAMVRRQLRVLLDEELALAALLGDGRDVGDTYKINEENIRPIWKENELFAIKETVTTKTDYKKLVKEIALTHKRYKGSGAPVFYTTTDHHTNFLWIEDNNGRRIYESDATLCAALRVSAIVEVPHMENKTRVDGTDTKELIGIKVNLSDYNFGADKGGQIASFEDFDIDFNQHKYLMETRCSGALTKAASAQIFEFVVPAQG